MKTEQVRTHTVLGRLPGFCVGLPLPVSVAGGLAALLLFSPGAHASDSEDRTQNICERYGALGYPHSYGNQTYQASLYYGGQVCNLRNKGITSLKPGDFDGLPNLVSLLLDKNALTSLPEDIFDGLSSLKELRIGSYDNSGLPENPVTTLPENIFDGLSEAKKSRSNFA